MLLLIKMCFFLNSLVQSNLLPLPINHPSLSSELRVLDLVMAVHIQLYIQVLVCIFKECSLLPTLTPEPLRMTNRLLRCSSRQTRVYWSPQPSACVENISAWFSMIFLDLSRLFSYKHPTRKASGWSMISLNLSASVSASSVHLHYDCWLCETRGQPWMMTILICIIGLQPSVCLLLKLFQLS